MDAKQCADRMNVLLELSRQINDPVPTAGDVARTVSVRLGRVVTAETIADGMNGNAQLPGSHLDAIAQHYNAPEALFSDSQKGLDVYNRLRACLEIRERYSDGGTNIIARGSRFTGTQVDEVMDFLGHHDD